MLKRNAARTVVIAAVVVGSGPTAPEGSTALSLCEAPVVTSVTCAPAAPPFSLELNEQFEVVLRNCSGDSAGALVTMVYSTPPAAPPGLDEFAADERTFVFAGHGEEAVCPIVDAIGGDPNMVDIAATPYRLTGGTWEERILPPTLQAQRYEGSSAVPPPDTNPDV